MLHHSLYLNTSTRRQRPNMSEDDVMSIFRHRRPSSLFLCRLTRFSFHSILLNLPDESVPYFLRSERPSRSQFFSFFQWASSEKAEAWSSYAASCYVRRVTSLASAWIRREVRRRQLYRTGILLGMNYWNIVCYLQTPIPILSLSCFSFILSSFTYTIFRFLSLSLFWWNK